jgi:hypothetical protein
LSEVAFTKTVYVRGLDRNSIALALSFFQRKKIAQAIKTAASRVLIVHGPRMDTSAPGLPDFSWYNLPKLEKYTK